MPNLRGWTAREVPSVSSQELIVRDIFHASNDDPTQHNTLCLKKHTYHVSAHTSTRAFRHVIKCVHGCTHNLTEEFNKTAVAVGLVILLLKGALVKLLEAKSTHKVLGVKLLAHGCDAAASDGFLAARAQ